MLLGHAIRHGLPLPGDWSERFPEGAGAPMLVARRGLGTFFLPRAPRRVGKADGELLHLSVRERMATDPRYRPIGWMQGPESYSQPGSLSQPSAKMTPSQPENRAMRVISASIRSSRPRLGRTSASGQ